MINIKVNTESTPYYILSSDIKSAIDNEFYADALIDIRKKYSELIYGSTARVICREQKKYGLYPHDIAAIFKIINIDAEFSDEKGFILNIDHTISGIFHR
jgi:hypothetical protein